MIPPPDIELRALVPPESEALMVAAGNSHFGSGGPATP
ncbi:hypothetical protein J2R87_004564 [Bradyrhizobium elkanii]|nr:hypothetical protein [Bradyrhizobium elkanii]MCS4107669.1 hypothetical protein [Bradyrhizobium elkanii]